MEPKTNEEPFIDLTDYGQYQVRINVSSKERGLEVIKALAEKDREKEEAVAEARREVLADIQKKYWLNPKRSKSEIAKENAWNDLGNTLRNGV